MNFLPVHAAEFWIVVVLINIFPHFFKDLFAIPRRKAARNPARCYREGECEYQGGENRVAREAGRDVIHRLGRSISLQNTGIEKMLRDTRRKWPNAGRPQQPARLDDESVLKVGSPG